MSARKYGEETKRLVLGAIKAYKTITTTEIAEMLGKPDSSIRYVCRALEKQGYVRAQELDDSRGRRLVWSLATGEAGPPPTKRPKRNTPEDPDYWVPQPWVHPYRRRILEG
jgi:predicted transcriptional regulator of viral defense system